MMDDLESLKALAGINNRASMTVYNMENMSYTGNEKAIIQKDNNIRPGTDEWFKLWFARPYLTGEKPFP